jgi:hypothetical protein
MQIHEYYAAHQQQQKRQNHIAIDLERTIDKIENLFIVKILNKLDEKESTST